MVGVLDDNPTGTGKVLAVRLLAFIKSTAAVADADIMRRRGSIMERMFADAIAGRLVLGPCSSLSP
ncbi:hypothetical protein AWC22_10640 [Mycobacterium riyadhense]|uniref:Uncharacterized protein n=1 Tax=Mycobacterium riyadhense TaxID=486698 RepID=A0A1X2DEY6_9MYCO|nr:hypothetical protein AWC22_10640 [Mycobacterium riyadhense]VTP01200.1 hypothetical protein BIN_B_03933 [Mycobacterium riyadhense]